MMCLLSLTLLSSQTVRGFFRSLLENTPFKGASPIEAASSAAKRWTGLFDGVFLLLYPNNPIEPWEVVPGNVLGARECHQIHP
jgi:hypothetical protein